MHPTAVINIVGLTESLIGEATPNISAFIQRGERGRPQHLEPVLPAVTCSVQSSMLTGLTPSEHGIVGNGWYNREQAEVQFWKQSNHLVQGEKVWHTARERDPSFTCANMFWWYNMYADVDIAVTPRPIYKADGRKIPDVYSDPPELRDQLQAKLGQFPLFHFWGPMTSIKSSEWIAEASMFVHDRHDPSLMLIYLPHLDYGLQKLGPEHADIPTHARAIDEIVGHLIEHFDRKNVRIILLSEYGVEPVTNAIPINRNLHEAGLLRVREEQGLELLDAGASDAFAAADHQIAHVYVKRAADVDRVAAMCRELDGVEEVLGDSGKAAGGIDHQRAGELVLIAQTGRWFSYNYWLDDRRAPDFARTVDIHRKPGYDPVELFIDPKLRLPKVRLAWKLLRKRLGLRTLMDVIPLDTTLVRGSHGRIDQPANRMPVLITERAGAESPDQVSCTAVRDIILEHLFQDA